MSRASSAAGVVTPNMVTATTGLCSAGTAASRSSYAWAIPAIAAAALANTWDETELMPATSTTEYMSVASTSPT